MHLKIVCLSSYPLVGETNLIAWLRTEMDRDMLAIIHVLLLLLALHALLLERFDVVFNALERLSAKVARWMNSLAYMIHLP